MDGCFGLWILVLFVLVLLLLLYTHCSFHIPLLPRRRFASGEGIVTLRVRLSRCVRLFVRRAATARRISVMCCIQCCLVVIVMCCNGRIIN